MAWQMFLVLYCFDVRSFDDKKHANIRKLKIETVPY